MKEQRLCKLWEGGGDGGKQIRCIISDVRVAYEAGYKLHNNTMTYDKLINLPFVHEVQLSKKCVIFDALRIKRIYHLITY